MNAYEVGGPFLSRAGLVYEVRRIIGGRRMATAISARSLTSAHRSAKALRTQDGRQQRERLAWPIYYERGAR